VVSTVLPWFCYAAEYGGLREYLKCCDYKSICNHNTSNILTSPSSLQFIITTHDNDDDDGVADIRCAVSPPVVNADDHDSPVSTTSTITTPDNNNDIIIT